MVYIRADANPKIGLGHIMRCLSIADAIKEAGYDITFILADNNVDLMIQKRGYQTIILYSDYTRMEDEVWPAGVYGELIVVDSYYVTPKYFYTLKKKMGAKIIYIDDLAAYPYPVDILVNYNLYGPSLDYQGLYNNSNVLTPWFLLGTLYAPLRTMFRGVPCKKQKKEARDILISTGGSDPDHIALKIVQARPKDRTYHILLGNMNEDKNAINQLAKANPHIVLHENVTDMKSLICSMDLVVSAAGSTLYEICACGVPLITYILADNQIPGAEAFEKLGLAINLGDMRGTGDPSKIILSSIEALVEDYEKRVSVGNKMQSMIDGFGADRIASSIIKIISGCNRQDS